MPAPLPRQAVGEQVDALGRGHRREHAGHEDADAGAGTDQRGGVDGDPEGHGRTACPTSIVLAVITALAGGVGAARFLRGLIDVLPPGDVTAVVNTGDDIVLHGLHISPDLDTVTYTLAGAIDPERG